MSITKIFLKNDYKMNSTSTYVNIPVMICKSRLRMLIVSWVQLIEIEFKLIVKTLII